MAPRKRGRPVVATRFDSVPYKAGEHCVYALKLANGLVKVGFSRNPRSRLKHLEWQVRRQFNCEFTSFYVGEPVPQDYKVRAVWVESAVLKRLATIGTPIPGSREFFRDVGFGVAVTLVRQMTRAHQIEAAA
jgi:hypothetical protein